MLSLTATDSAGLSATETDRLNPRTANVTLAQTPAGLQLSFASETLAHAVHADGDRALGHLGQRARRRRRSATPVPSAPGATASGPTHAITAPASGTATYTATYAGHAVGDLAGARTPSGRTRPPRRPDGARSTA